MLPPGGRNWQLIYPVGETLCDSVITCLRHIVRQAQIFVILPNVAKSSMGGQKCQSKISPTSYLWDYLLTYPEGIHQTLWSRFTHSLCKQETLKLSKFDTLP